MELEKIKITDINPAEYNPRRISDDEFLKLQNSISTFGVVDPIIINLRNNKIIGGHQRYDVLLDEYMKEGDFLEELHLLRLGDVGWVFPDTDLEIKSEDHEKALNLALNKISGEWDEPKLESLLEELSLEGFNLELTGFDKLELTELDINLDEDSHDDYEVTEDEYEAPDDLEVNVEMGDVFKLGNHVLVCGDSTVKEYIDKLLKIDGGEISIDLVFTDPPYGNGKKHGRYGRGGLGVRTILGDEDFTTFQKFIENMTQSRMIFFLQWRTIAEAILTLRKKEMNLNTVAVWNKKSPGLRRWGGISEQWEAVLFCGDIEYKKFGGNIFEVARTSGKREDVPHPHMKPLPLMEEIFDFLSDDYKNIFDPFGGSGSTLIFCEQTNRNCYMMELDPYYCQIIINRWEEYTGEKAEKLN